MEDTRLVGGYTQYDVEDLATEYVVPTDPMQDLQCDSCQ